MQVVSSSCAPCRSGPRQPRASLCRAGKANERHFTGLLSRHGVYMPANGAPIKAPPETGVKVYPISGEDASYSGLCAYNCNHGYCPSGACGTVEVPLTIPDVSDFSPPACRAGIGTGALTGLCSFSCTYG